IGDEKRPARVHHHTFRLLEERRGAAWRGPPGQELRASVDQAVEHAHRAIAVERRQEELAALADDTHLRVGKWRPDLKPRLALRREAGAAGRNAIQPREVVGLAAGVPAAAARQVE